MNQDRVNVVLFASFWAALLALAATPRRAWAERVDEPCASIMDANNDPIDDPRLAHLTIAGVKVNVLLPPHYDKTHRAYPVLYLFHGAFGDEDSFTTQTDLLSLTASLPDREQVLIVMPDGGHLPAGRDWVDGSHLQETFLIETLLPYVESHYAVLPGGGQRATAGFSAGGMNALTFAARHPEMFAAAASFSGFVDPFSSAGQAVVQQFAELDNALCGASDDWLQIWGDPVHHPMGWLGHDPVNLARNLGQTALYLSAHDGSGCPGGPEPDPALAQAEAIVFEMGQTLAQALRSDGVPYRADFGGCGVHAFANANQGLRNFWPLMLRAFGRTEPWAFDYVSGDAQARAWGWSVTADPLRAPEFLALENASRFGVMVSGSGRTQISTAPYFRPLSFVRVVHDGVWGERVRAGRDGRITVGVDLGMAHALEGGTAGANAVQAADPEHVRHSRLVFVGL